MAEPIPFDHGLDRLSLDYIINISYMSRSTTTPGRLVGRLGRTETEGMFENKTKVLLILPQDALDRARVLAGKAVPLTHSCGGPRGDGRILNGPRGRGLRECRLCCLASQVFL